MKKFQLSDEEKIALLEKIKSYPRPAKFTRTVVETTTETTTKKAKTTTTTTTVGIVETTTSTTTINP
jgi:hypothetical protein